MRRITRRTMLAGTGAGMAALAFPPLAGAVDDGVATETVWQPVGLDPIISWRKVGQAENELSFPTVLPLRHLTGNPALPVWALYAWHHDNTDGHFHIFTAPAITGPWTEEPALPGPPGIASGWVRRHFSSGDVVWDPEGNRLIGTPHSLTTATFPDPLGLGRPPQPKQTMFLIESTDGFNWSWLGGNNGPRIIPGSANNNRNQYGGTYGRQLRDLDGVMVRNGGRWWHIYRGAGSLGLHYALLASASSMNGTWTTNTTVAFPNPYGPATLLGFNALIQAQGRPMAIYQPVPAAFVPNATWFTQSTNGGFNFPTGGAPMVIGATAPYSDLFSAGVSIIRDPITRKQYLVLATLFTDGTPNNQGDGSGLTALGSDFYLFKQVG